MPRQVLLLLSLAVSYYTNSQDLVSFIVKNIKKEPVPYCSIAWNKSNGIVTNELGLATIPVSEIKDSVTISSVGYKTKIIYAADITGHKEIEVILDDEITELQEVQVWAKEYSKELGLVVKKEGSSYFRYGSCTNLQNVILISGYNIPARLSIFSVFISEKSSTSLPFRVRIYNKGEDGLPGQSIISKNIIVSDYKKNKWCDVNLEDQSLYLPSGGFFIGIEWLCTDIKVENGLCIGEDDMLKDHITFVKWGQTGWRHIKSTFRKAALNSMMKVKVTTPYKN